MTSEYHSFIRLKQLLIDGLRLVFAIVCLASILACLAFLTNQLNCTNCPLRSKYGGQVIDKSLTVSESQFGSRLRRQLLIQSKNGEKFEVIATESVFNKARIGNWVKADEQRIEFSDESLP